MKIAPLPLDLGWITILPLWFNIWHKLSKHNNPKLTPYYWPEGNGVFIFHRSNPIKVIHCTLSCISLSLAFRFCLYVVLLPNCECIQQKVVGKQVLSLALAYLEDKWFHSPSKTGSILIKHNIRVQLYQNHNYKSNLKFTFFWFVLTNASKSISKLMW